MSADRCVTPPPKFPARHPGYAACLLLVTLVCLFLGMTQDAIGGPNPTVTIDLGQTGP
jgi:hypothetical protein